MIFPVQIAGLKTRCVPQQALGGLSMPLTISTKDCPIQLSFRVKVHGFPIEWPRRSHQQPSCSIPAGRSDHQVEPLAMSDR
ncbi:hypothetical protein EV363DRAFT_1166350 [Boletus edulis]|nr:hypothetical protein EV363DRAFT_1166350 [Boletus edulis]